MNRKFFASPDAFIPKIAINKTLRDFFSIYPLVEVFALKKIISRSTRTINEFTMNSSRCIGIIGEMKESLVIGIRKCEVLLKRGDLQL